MLDIDSDPAKDLTVKTLGISSDIESFYFTCWLHLSKLKGVSKTHTESKDGRRELRVYFDAHIDMPPDNLTEGYIGVSFPEYGDYKAELIGKNLAYKVIVDTTCEILNKNS